jgi:hypothetical protein
VGEEARAGEGKHMPGGLSCFLNKTADYPSVPMGNGFEVWLCEATAPRIESLKGRAAVLLAFVAREVPWRLSIPPE